MMIQGAKERAYFSPKRFQAALGKGNRQPERAMAWLKGCRMGQTMARRRLAGILAHQRRV
jgi:hypothetical protein